MVFVTHQASKDYPQSLAPSVQSACTPSAIAQLSTPPLSPDERKAVADGWTALPVTNVSCFLLFFLEQLDIPLVELQPYHQRTLSKILLLQTTAPIGAPTQKLVIELGQGFIVLEPEVTLALLGYVPRRVLHPVAHSMLSGITFELSSGTAIQSISDLLAAVKGGDLEILFVCCGASELVKACQSYGKKSTNQFVYSMIQYDTVPDGRPFIVICGGTALKNYLCLPIDHRLPLMSDLVTKLRFASLL